VVTVVAAVTGVVVAATAVGPGPVVAGDVDPAIAAVELGDEVVAAAAPLGPVVASVAFDDSVELAQAVSDTTVDTASSSRTGEAIGHI
jgi:hypothetical protein